MTIKEGDIYNTNNGGSCTVLHYLNSHNVVIKFNDTHGHVKTISAGDLR